MKGIVFVLLAAILLEADGGGGVSHTIRPFLITQRRFFIQRCARAAVCTYDMMTFYLCDLKRDHPNETQKYQDMEEKFQLLLKKLSENIEERSGLEYGDRTEKICESLTDWCHATMAALAKSYSLVVPEIRVSKLHSYPPLLLNRYAKEFCGFLWHPWDSYYYVMNYLKANIKKVFTEFHERYYTQGWLFKNKMLELCPIIWLFKCLPWTLPTLDDTHADFNSLPDVYVKFPGPKMPSDYFIASHIF